MIPCFLAGEAWGEQKGRAVGEDAGKSTLSGVNRHSNVTCSRIALGRGEARPTPITEQNAMEVRLTEGSHLCDGT